jgi:hypothetical protein
MQTHRHPPVGTHQKYRTTQSSRQKWVWGFGDVALDNTDIFQTIGRCVVAEAVSTEVAHVGSPAIIGS